MEVVETTDWEAIMRKYEGTRYDYDNFDREDFIRLNPGVDFEEFITQRKQWSKSKKLEEAQVSISQSEEDEVKIDNKD